jgi:hypothetical protein
MTLAAKATFLAMYMGTSGRSGPGTTGPLKHPTATASFL